MKIIAIGGGGFTHGTDAGLDDFVLAQSPVHNPRIGYIGTANSDLPERIDRFYARFASYSATTSHLPESTTGNDAAEWVAGQDMIYVGGGNTKHLLDSWHQSGIDRLLVDAAKSGTLLAGVSAGAVCWFEFAFSNYSEAGFLPVPGLGLVPGSCCPHYSTEPDRPPAFKAAIANGDLPGGLAIDDGVAVFFDGSAPARAFSTRDGASARLVRRSPKGSVIEPIAAMV